MKNFKVEVSKGLEKYNLIRKAESEILLREELHKEGFSILSIQSMGDIEISGNKFFFEIIQDGNLKVGTIVSNDLFKAYLKIKDELKFELKYIYSEKDTSIEEKERIISELKEQYRIYLNTNKKEIQKKEINETQKIKVQKEESVESFEMKKELDEVYKIIDKVLFKLKSFLELNNIEFLNFEKKEKLKEIYNVIIRLKTSTNIPKLRQIGEIALTKIGEIELQILEDKKDIESKKLLNETNLLLKEIGSKKTFIEKEKDLSYILSNIFNSFLEYLKESKKPVKQKVVIDKTSTVFLKTKLLIEKYDTKLKDINKEIYKNFIVFLIPTEKNKEQKINYLLRKKVLNQNLMILKSRLSGTTYSYTKIVKGYDYFIEKILNIIYFLKYPILIIIILNSIIFLLLNLLNKIGIIGVNINFNGIFYFIYLNLIFVLIRNVKGFLSLIFNFVIFSFLLIFGVINF